MFSMNDFNDAANEASEYLEERDKARAERDALAVSVSLLTKEIRGLYASESEALASCRAARLKLEEENKSLATQLQQLKRQLAFLVPYHPSSEDV